MSDNWNWKQENKSRHSAGPDTFVQRSPGGWGQRFNAYCEREWAGCLKGQYLRTAAGQVRQFATSAAAKRAVEDADLARAMIDRTCRVHGI